VEDGAMLQATVGVHNSPHVIVVGNEKGGSGKTTIAMHLAVALMKTGQRVATIDLDSRQRTLTHYVENRRGWAWRTELALEIPDHFIVGRAEGVRIDQNESDEFAELDRAISAVQQGHEFLVIDTPPHDTYLMRLAHSMADTLVTPINDSFVDFDVLATVDPVTFAVNEPSHYGEMVVETRRHRQSVDGALMDWVVVCNRVSPGSSVKPVLCAALKELALRLGFRGTQGLSERSAYREFFPRGLTTLDEPRAVVACIDAAPGLQPAWQEVTDLLGDLRLPIDERGRRRAARRAEWSASRGQPLDVDDMLFDNELTEAKQSNSG
jgi:chromosome partitioning protein